MNPMINYENFQRTNSFLFEAYKDELVDFLNSGWFVLGKGVASFEQEFSKYCQVDY